MQEMEHRRLLKMRPRELKDAAPDLHSSRRQFLLGAPALALGLEPAKAWMREPPPPAGHKAQVNVQSWDINAYGQDFPFIDVARQISNVWAFYGTSAASDIYSYINSNGYPTQMPLGSTPGDSWNGNTKAYLTPRCTFTGSINSSGVLTVTGSVKGEPIFVGQTLKGSNIAVDTVIISGSGNTWQTNVNTAVASATLTAFDPWILDWVGRMSPRVGSNSASVTGRTISSNRIQYDITWSGHGAYTTFDITVYLQGITVAPTSIRIFRKSEEALLNAGQITSPHFISFYRKWGRMRYMDILRTNNVTIAQWSQRSLMTDCSWVGASLRTALYGGLCTNSGNDFTAPTSLYGSNTSWNQGDMFLCRITNAPAIKTVSGFTNANPAKVTVAAHGYSTGDLVTFPRVDVSPVWNPGGIEVYLNRVPSGNPGLSPAYTITVVDANNFTLNGTDSTIWPGPYVSGGSVMKCIRFKCGSLPFKRITYPSFQNLYESDILNTLNKAVPGGEVVVNSLTYNSTADVLTWVVGADNAGNGLIGAPYEVILQVANEVGVSPWLCLPYMSDASYATSLANLVKSNLNSNIICGFEFSNEVWNLSTALTSYASVMGQLLFPSSGQQNMNEWYGFSVYNSMNAITTAFSGQLNRIRRIISFKADNFSSTEATARLTAPHTTAPAAPYTVCDELSFASYNNVDGSVYPLASTVYNYKQGIATSNPTLIASAFSDLDAAFNSPYAAFTGGIDNGSGGAGNILTVSAVSVGSIYTGLIISGGGLYFNFPNPPVVTGQLTGTPGGAGTYSTSGSSLLIGAGSSLTSTIWSNVGTFNSKIFPFWKSFATTYNLGMSQYEGGWGVVPDFGQFPTSYSGNPLTHQDTVDLFIAYQASSNYATVLQSMLTNFRNQGGIYPSQYVLTSSAPITSNMFGMVYPNIFALTDPAYAAYVAFNNN
jgi:hypothetical protein